MYDEYCWYVRLAKKEPEVKVLVGISRGDADLWSQTKTNKDARPELRKITKQNLEELFAEDENFYDPPENGEPDEGPKTGYGKDQSDLDDILEGDSSLRPPTTQNKIGNSGAS